MKLTKLYVKSFGKLTDFTVNLQDGLNVTVQRNGFGKSTLVAFIKAMFYGFEYKKKSGGIETDARTYMPWNSKEKFGGFAEFIHNGATFRVERYFGATARSEEGQLINLTTGATYSVDGLGKKLFGVDATAFSQSLYIAQEVVEITANDDFISKLTDMVDGNKTENNFQKAEDRLRALSKTYRYEKGNGGLIYQTQMQLDNAHRQLSASKQSQQDLLTAKQRLNNLQQQSNQLQQQKDSCDQQISILQQKVQTSTQSPEQIKQMQTWQQSRNYIVSHDSAVIEDEATAVSLARQLTMQQQENPKMSPLVYLATLVMAVGVVLAVALSNIFYVGIAVTVVGAVFGATLIANYFKAKDNCNKQTSNLAQQLQRLFSKYNLSGTVEQNLDDLQSLRQTYQNHQVIYQTLQGSVQQSTPDVSQDKRKLDELLNQKRQIEQSLTLVNVEVGSLQSKIDYLSQQPSVVETQEQVDNLQQQLQTQESKYQTIQTTLGLLRKAKEQVSSSYLPPLASKVRQLLQMVIDIDDVIVDENFAVSLQEGAVTRPVQLFSRGVQELTAFCFRVALSQSIYGETLPLLVVDDAFVNLDDANFGKAMQILNNLAQNSQVIYFSCHERSKTN